MNRYLARLKPGGIRIVDEPFHHMRNLIIDGLQGTWAKSTYWKRFPDQDLLRAVMTKMQTQGELFSRYVDGSYEWSVSAEAQKMQLPVYDR